MEPEVNTFFFAQTAQVSIWQSMVGESFRLEPALGVTPSKLRQLNVGRLDPDP